MRGSISNTAVLLVTLAVACAGQSTCPRVVPSSIHLFLPESLPPGPHPYVRDFADVWVFCDGAPAGGVPFQVTSSGSQLVSTNQFSNSHALAESDTLSLWPNLRVTALSMAVAPAVGTQQASIQINAGGGSISLPVTVTFTAASFTHSYETALAFRFPGDASFQSEPLWFPNARTSIGFVAGAESTGWLSVSPVSGSGYTELGVQADPASVALGSYFGFITVTTPDAINSPLKIPVRMLVDSTGLSSFPPSLAFSQVAGGVPPAAQSLSLNNYYGPTAFTISTDASWLSVAPSSGATPASVTVSVNSAGLSPGTYSGNLTVAPPGATSLKIPVQLTIRPPNYITLSPSAVTFFAWPNMSGDDQKLLGDINITSTRPLTWSATKSVDAAWLNPPNYLSGTTPFHLLFGLDWGALTSLLPGDHTGQIIITSDEATNSPQAVTVHGMVLAAPPLKLTGDFFMFQSQGEDPPPQTLSVSAASPTPFTVSASSDGNWLAVSSSSLVTPATLTAFVKTAGVEDGFHDGTLTLFATQPSGPPIPMHVLVSLILHHVPAPALTNLFPSSATAGGPAFTLSIYGTNFAGGDGVLWNGVPLPTTLVSVTELQAAVAANQIASAAIVSVTVSIPGGMPSNALAFTINASALKAPTLTSLLPSSATVGQPFTLTVNGTNFLNGARVQWNSAPLMTTYISSTQLQAAVPASDIAVPGIVNVTVLNPDASTSNALAFTINPAPVPTLTSLSPSSANAGGEALTLIVTGTNFAPDSVILWSAVSYGVTLVPTYVGATQLSVSVPRDLIASAGTASVIVSNPGGAKSNAVTFTINPAPAVTLTSLNPSSATAGGPDFTLILNGTNFVREARVLWSSLGLLPATYVSATQLSVLVPALAIARSGTVSVSILTTGGYSNALIFTIDAPTP